MMLLCIYCAILSWSMYTQNLNNTDTLQEVNDLLHKQPATLTITSAQYLLNDTTSQLTKY